MSTIWKDSNNGHRLMLAELPVGPQHSNYCLIDLDSEFPSKQTQNAYPADYPVAKTVVTYANHFVNRDEAISALLNAYLEIRPENTTLERLSMSEMQQKNTAKKAVSVRND